MSNQTYNDVLCETSELIGEATQADEAVFAVGSADRAALQPLFSELRVRYTLLLSRLDTVYDQLLQPQKRLIVRRLLEACLGRLVEIKHDLVEVHMSDFTFDDDEVRNAMDSLLLFKVFLEKSSLFIYVGIMIF